MSVCTIYCDASYNPSTNVGAVAFRAKYMDKTLSSSISLEISLPPSLHGKHRKKNANIQDLETFGILYAIRCCKRAGFCPDVFFVNCDNLDACHLFWPWMESPKSKRMIRFRDLTRKIAGISEIRIKHVRAHTNKSDVRSWSNDYCDIKAKQARRNHERRNRQSNQLREA